MGQGTTHTTQVEEENVKAPTHENAPKSGESLLMNKVSLNLAKEIKILAQRKTLFKTMRKVKGKCCKFIGITRNLVYTKMDE